MKGKLANLTSISDKLIWIGIGLGVFSWIAEAYIHVLVFPQESFAEQLLSPPLHDIWLRSVIAGLLILFSVCAQFIINQRKQAEEALQKVHDELEQRIEERTAELASMTDKLQIELLERTVAEKALQESETRLRAIFNAAENISLIMTDLADTEAHILELSRGAEQMFGYNREEVIGKPVAVLHLPEDVLKFPAVINSMRQRKEGFTGESTLVRKSGERFPALFTTYPIFDSKDNMTATLGVSIDITKRKQAEDALKESEERYRVVFEGSAEGILVADIETQEFKYVNQAICRMLGYTEEELKQMSVSDIHPKEALEHVISEFKAQAREEKTLAPSIPCLRKDGTTIYADINTANVLINGRECNVGLFTDITEKNQAEKQIRLLSQQLIRAQEIERQMISRELHDSVAQELSAIKICFDSIVYNHQEVPDETRQMFLEYSKTLQNSIMAVRDLAYDLRPPGLDQLGIIQTIFQYCEDFSEKTGLSVDFSSAGMENLNLDADMKINLYRLVQEGLINIRKHAEARQVTVKLTAAFPNIILRIKDDGKGFDVNERLLSAQNEKRMGLRSMEERVGLLGGKMNIKSNSTEGTSIFIKFPHKDIIDE